MTDPDVDHGPDCGCDDCQYLRDAEEGAMWALFEARESTL